MDWILWKATETKCLSYYISTTMFCLYFSLVVLAMNYNMSYYHDVYHRLGNRANNSFGNVRVSESQIEWIKVDEKDLEIIWNGVNIHVCVLRDSSGYGHAQNLE